MRLTRQQKWFLLAGATSVVAAQVTRMAIRGSWKLASGNEPPGDPVTTDSSWKRTLLFGAVTAAVISAVQLSAERGAAELFQRTTGKRPPRKKR